MACIILYGLKSDLAGALARILCHDGHRVHTADSLDSPLPPADLVFACGDGPDYQETVRRLVARQLPVIVVNRIPDNARWLDALDLGAADYCGAPFETVQVRWLVDAVLGTAPAAAA